MKPITKKEIELKLKLKQREFPDFVIQAFNECIEESKTKHSSVVLQNVVVSRIKKLGSVSSKTIFDNKWLDVEEYYSAAGWKVSYDKPAYNESYEASFTFK